MKAIRPLDSRSAILIAIFMIISLSSYSSYATDPGGFAGIALGSTSYSDDQLIDLCSDFGLDCSSDSSDTALKLFGGYRFNPYIVVEAGYADWGEVSVEPVGGAGLSFDFKGPYIAVLPEIPVSDNFSIIGELAVGFLDANLRANLPALGEVASFSDSITTPIFGLGGVLHLDQVSFRFMWESIDPDETYSVEGVNVSSPELDLYTIAVVIRF